MSGRIPLTQLAPKLRPYLGDRTPNYHKLYFLGLSGVIELKRDPGCRGYYVDEQDIPTLAEAVREQRA